MSNNSLSPAAYLHIAAWGSWLHSNGYYVQQEQNRAAQDKAPVNAIYYSPDEGRWVTVDEIRNDVTRAAIERLALDYRRILETGH
jgi:hypothetical protein